MNEKTLCKFGMPMKIVQFSPPTPLSLKENESSVDSKLENHKVMKPSTFFWLWMDFFFGKKIPVI